MTTKLTISKEEYLRLVQDRYDWLDSLEKNSDVKISHVTCADNCRTRVWECTETDLGVHYSLVVNHIYSSYLMHSSGDETISYGEKVEDNRSKLSKMMSNLEYVEDADITLEQEELDTLVGRYIYKDVRGGDYTLDDVEIAWIDWYGARKQLECDRIIHERDMERLNKSWIKLKEAKEKAKSKVIPKRKVITQEPEPLFTPMEIVLLLGVVSFVVFFVEVFR